VLAGVLTDGEAETDAREGERDAGEREARGLRRSQSV